MGRQRPRPSSSNLKYAVQYKIGNLAYTGWLTDVGYSEASFQIRMKAEG
ncbi:MAG: hypothetical protein HS114_14775 [Anaerolineales bacterium]|nr:hypothetical protein [Anaerolineales bacterium]